MDFWTIEKFKKFIACVDNPMYSTLFYILYDTGLRCGEVLALTPADIDLEEKMIHVTKTFHRYHGQDIITTPKTSNSIRIVPIPEFLCDQIQNYTNRLYGLKASDRIIPLINASVCKVLDRFSEKAGVKRIRVHDVRHLYVKPTTKNISL